MNNYLDFEKSIEEIDKKIRSLKQNETKDIENIAMCLFDWDIYTNSRS